MFNNRIKYLTQKQSFVLDIFKQEESDLCKLSITHGDVWCVAYKVGSNNNWDTVIVFTDIDLSTALDETVKHIKWCEKMESKLKEKQGC